MAEKYVNYGLYFTGSNFISLPAVERFSQTDTAHNKSVYVRAKTSGFIGMKEE